MMGRKYVNECNAALKCFENATQYFKFLLHWQLKSKIFAVHKDLIYCLFAKVLSGIHKIHINKL